MGIRPADEVWMRVVEEGFCGFSGRDAEGGWVGGVLEGVELEGGFSDGRGEIEECERGGGWRCLRMRYDLFLRGLVHGDCRG